MCRYMPVMVVMKLHTRGSKFTTLTFLSQGGQIFYAGALWLEWDLIQFIVIFIQL